MCWSIKQDEVLNPSNVKMTRGEVFTVTVKTVVGITAPPTYLPLLNTGMSLGEIQLFQISINIFVFLGSLKSHSSPLSLSTTLSLHPPQVLSAPL